MGKFCEVCKKGTMSGNLVSHSNRKTKRSWAPNIQTTGYNYERLREKMGWLDIDPASIQHIFITHQDTDHVGALERDSELLFKNAPIVLLDEATASLDVENETKVQGALSRLLAGKTVLVIAHRMRTVEAADRIVVLADGKVAEEGSPDELLAKEDGIFRRMTQLQSASAGWSI